MRNLLQHIEAALWAAHDERAKAAGLQVTRLSRWSRRYRNPRVTIALAAVAARPADESVPAGLGRAA